MFEYFRIALYMGLYYYRLYIVPTMKTLSAAWAKGHISFLLIICHGCNFLCVSYFTLASISDKTRLIAYNKFQFILKTHCILPYVHETVFKQSANMHKIPQKLCLTPLRLSHASYMGSFPPLLSPDESLQTFANPDDIG